MGGWGGGGGGGGQVPKMNDTDSPLLVQLILFLNDEDVPKC